MDSLSTPTTPDEGEEARAREVLALREALQDCLFHLGHSATCALGALYNCTCGVSEVQEAARATLKGER